MSQAFIELEHVCYSYEIENNLSVPVLHDLSLSISEGEYVAILGHNGSGKSTLAKLLNMILTPTEGRILVDGKEITKPDLSDAEIFALRRSIGMVFQNPDNQLVATIVEDDVAFGPENLGIPPQEIRERVARVLGEVGMTAYAKHEPHRLSGGQKQRVAIAGILAMQPKCIIFDESTAMLDPLGRREVLAAMERLNRELGITVITITHYMDEAARASRVIVLNDGRIMMDGTPGEIFAQEAQMQRYGLDVPQCTALMHRLMASGMELDGDFSTPEGCAKALLAWKERKKNHG